MNPGLSVVVVWRYDPIGRVPEGYTTIPDGLQVTKAFLVECDRDGVTVTTLRDGRNRVMFPWPQIVRLSMSMDEEDLNDRCDECMHGEHESCTDIEDDSCCCPPGASRHYFQKSE